MVKYHCYNSYSFCYIKIKFYGTLGYRKNSGQFYVSRNYNLKINDIDDLTLYTEEEEFQQLTVYEPVMNFEYDELKEIQEQIKKLSNIFSADFKITVGE